jgi:inner membrane protein
MLLFAHMGIALGAGILLDKSLTGSHPFSTNSKFQLSSPSLRARAPSQSFEHSEEAANRQRSNLSDNPPTSLASPKKHLDYRFLLIGSFLPDLIDKPIGDVFFYQTFQNGQIFAHTLCFTIFLALLGAYVYRGWKKSWCLMLSFGCAIHLILDGLWLHPRTLFWPIYGWSFPKLDPVNFFGWLPGMLHILVANPIVYISELVGFAILAWAAVRLIQMGKVHAFITNRLVE